MKVTKLQIKQFFCHKDFELTLPDKGIVLVTGNNGVGKSSLVESVSWAIYGSTIRGSRPHGDVFVVTDKGTVQRTRDAKFHTVHIDGLAQDTATKANELLVPRYGDFDTWRRSHVFSSSDASRFTDANDSERKRFLESILGLGKFDNALKLCRADIKTANTRKALLETKLLKLQNSVEELERSIPPLEKLVGEYEGETEEQLIDASTDKLDQAADLEKEAELLIDLYSKEAAQYEVAKSRVDDQRLKVDRLRLGLCDTCGQTIGQDILESHIAACRSLEMHLDTTQFSVDKSKIAEIRKEAIKLRKQATELLNRAAQVANQVIAQENLKESKERYEAAESEISSLEDELESIDSHLDLLAACETVLGLRGVRAHILSKALKGLERSANMWLSRLTNNFSLSINPYTEQKNGAVVDAISLTIENHDGQSYRDLSGGERRRIDLSLLFALTDMATAASGNQEPGTLWLDEIFDSIDSDGIGNVVEVLRDFAARRTVVLISHSESLIATLRPDKHIQL